MMKEFRLEKIEVVSEQRFDDKLTIVVVKSLFDAEGEFCLTSYKLDKYTKRNIEAVRYFMSNENGRFKRLENYGHGWHDDAGNEYDTCEGKVRFYVTSPGFILQEHNIPGKGMEYVLYVDELFVSSRVQVNIPDKPELSKLCNNCLGVSKENVVSQKAYNKKRAQVNSGKITEEEFDEWLAGRYVEEETNNQGSEKVSNTEEVSKSPDIVEPKFELGEHFPEKEMKVDLPNKTEATPVHEVKEERKTEINQKILLPAFMADNAYKFALQKQLHEEKIRKLYEEKIHSLDGKILDICSMSEKLQEMVENLKTETARLAIEKAKIDAEYQDAIAALIQNP